MARRKVKQPTRSASAARRGRQLRSLEVVVEGQSEHRYADALKRRHHQSVTIIVNKRYMGKVKQLIARATVTAREQEVQDNKPGTVWCLLDTEADAERGRLIADAVLAGVNVAWSTPCLEAWFVIHRQPCTWRLTAREMKNEFESVFGRAWNDLDPLLPELLDTWEAARERAQALDRQHASGTSDGSLPEPADRNPASNVWEMIEAITQSSVSPP